MGGRHMQSAIRTGEALVLLLACTLMPQSTAKAQYKLPTGSRSGYVITKEGVRIHYLEAGPDARIVRSPAILFVPGWTMPAEIWEHQITYFAKAQRVVAMDPRSQGLSSQTSEGNHPEVRARDIKAVVDQLKLAPAVLVGWSMGVTELAAYVDQFGTDGVAALVLVDGIAGWDVEPEMMREEFDWLMPFMRDRRAAAARFVREMYKKPQSQEYLDRITRASLRTPTNTAMALLLGNMAVDRRPALAKIRRPTLIVAAEGPYLRMFEDMQRRITDSHLKVLEGVGHALFVDAADQFNALLEEFLKRTR